LLRRVHRATITVLLNCVHSNMQHTSFDNGGSKKRQSVLLTNEYIYVTFVSTKLKEKKPTTPNVKLTG
jgi:hypothetical protein